MHEDDEVRASPAQRKKAEWEMIMLVYHRARLLLLLARLSLHSRMSCNDPGGPWANGCLKFCPALTSRSTPSFNKSPERGHRCLFIFLLFSWIFQKLLLKKLCRTDPRMTELCSVVGYSLEGSGSDTMVHICHHLHEYVWLCTICTLKAASTKLSANEESAYMNHSVCVDNSY